MPSTPPLTRREVLATALITGALGGDAAAQESDADSGESTPTASSADWPSFQNGPRNAGHAPSAHGPNDPVSARWSRRIESAGVTAPAVADGTVYVGSSENSVVALSTVDGTEEWEFSTGEDVASSPAVDKGRVYVGSDDGTVWAVHAGTGAELWSFEAGDRIRSSPVVAEVRGAAATETSGTTGATDSTNSADGSGETERRVFVGSDDGSLYALDAADGTVRWTYEVDSPVGSPAVGPAGGASASPDSGRRVYVGDRDGGVYALSAVDGGERWTADVGDATTAPTVARDQVYVGAGDDGLAALTAVDGTERWRFSPGGPVVSPAVAGDSLFVPVSDDGVYAISTFDGTELWHESLDGKHRPAVVAGGGARDSSSAPSGTVFVVQMAGDVLVRALSTTDGRQRWAHEISAGRAAVPAVVDDTVYVNAGGVVALTEVTPTPTAERTPWDADAVAESWAPSIGSWLGAYVGAPAVLGALVYALERFGRRSGGVDQVVGGDGDDVDRDSGDLGGEGGNRDEERGR